MEFRGKDTRKERKQSFSSCLSLNSLSVPQCQGKTLPFLPIRCSKKLHCRSSTASRRSKTACGFARGGATNIEKQRVMSLRYSEEFEQSASFVIPSNWGCCTLRRSYERHAGYAVQLLRQVAAAGTYYNFVLLLWGKRRGRPEAFCCAVNIFSRVSISRDDLQSDTYVREDSYGTLEVYSVRGIFLYRRLIVPCVELEDDFFLDDGSRTLALVSAIENNQIIMP